MVDAGRGNDELRFVRLLTASGPFEAKLLAARLGSEGLLWELRPGVDGPYPLGPIGVYVEASRYDEARELITGVPADEDSVSRRLGP